MIPVGAGSTIGEAFEAAVARFPDRLLLTVPANPERSYLPDGAELTYRAIADEVGRLTDIYRAAGYGTGHRVALLLENRPSHVTHKLALNALGACVVPVNPDYRAGETAYLVDHARVDLALAVPERAGQLREGMGAASHKPAATLIEGGRFDPPRAARPAGMERVTAETPASILYTSGTTGRPKGCVLSQGYELASGAWYATRGGLAAFRDGDRLYNPLPLYHVNAGILSLFAMLLTGNTQVQTDRFHPGRFWREVRETQASVVHYLGVIVPMLLGRPETADDRRHGVRFGVGAGVEPSLHARFEARFGFPLVELWGMTEMVRVIIDTDEPREVGTRSFGRATSGLEVRVVDENDREVADPAPGEMVVRHSAATPRAGFFSGYLDDADATATAWRGGWFHTGDVVWRGADGRIHFADRKKNIIRRSGENIAAAEVEAVLLAHAAVAQVAVLAVADEVREEEVAAVVVLRAGTGDRATAEALVRHCLARLAYFKAPGYVLFADHLPTTGTQKIQKHQIFPPGTDPRTLPACLDVRPLKRRDPA